MRNILQESLFIRGLIIGEMIPFPVWIILFSVWIIPFDVLTINFELLGKKETHFVKEMQQRRDRQGEKIC